MKKTILLLLTVLLAVTGYSQQGSFPVAPGFGQTQEAAHRQRVIDSAGNYYNNTTPQLYDLLQSYGILGDVVYMMSPAANDEGYLMAQIPTDGTGDATATRASIATFTNDEGYLEEAAIDYPRIDFSDGVPYVSTEKQLEQLITYSEDFDNAYWTKSGSTIDDNGGAGYSDPANTTNAFKLVEDGTTGTHFISSVISFTSGNTYTASVYAKKGERNWTTLRAANSTTWAAESWFDLENGVVGTATLGTAEIEYIVDGWYKCSVTGVAGATAVTSFQILLADADQSFAYAGTLGNGAYIFGANLFEADYPASYVYTNGATATRIGDALSGAGDAALFADVNASGVLYAEIAAHSDDAVSKTISISNGTSSTAVSIYYNGTKIYSDFIISGTQASMSHTLADVTIQHKVAIRWAVNDFSLWVDGVEVATDLSGITFPASTLSELAFDYGNGTKQFYGKCKEVMVLNYLTDAQMITLTEMGMNMVSMFPLILLMISFAIRRKSPIEFKD